MILIIAIMIIVKQTFKMISKEKLPKQLDYFYNEWKTILQQELEYGIRDNDIQLIENSKRRLKALEKSFSAD
tara:strand:- start:265 stop:480 length:216 start_codon:yes stop_codon:yes gene_type:complete